MAMSMVVIMLYGTVVINKKNQTNSLNQSSEQVNAGHQGRLPPICSPHLLIKSPVTINHLASTIPRTAEDRNKIRGNQCKSNGLLEQPPNLET